MEKVLQEAVLELLDRKKYTGEKEQKPHMPVILRFIEEELERQRQIVDQLPDDHNKDWTALNDCFRRVIGYEEK